MRSTRRQSARQFADRFRLDLANSRGNLFVHLVVLKDETVLRTSRRYAGG